VQILQEGLKHWPDSEELCTCLGVNFMNLREFDKALSLFSKFPESKTAGNYAAACRRALRDSTILLTS
jgi:anaerobic magnesium-protoporphyrin IX monomethyl ester cyclase